MKPQATPSQFRAAGRNAYPDGVNPYVWRDDQCACGNWDEGFVQAKYAADWKIKHEGECDARNT